MLEDQESLIEQLQQRSATLRRLLEEEEILLEEYHRLGQQVTEEANHTYQALLDLIEQTADAIGHSETEVVSHCLKELKVQQPEEPALTTHVRHLLLKGT